MRWGRCNQKKILHVPLRISFALLTIHGTEKDRDSLPHHSDFDFVTVVASWEGDDNQPHILTRSFKTIFESRE